MDINEFREEEVIYGFPPFEKKTIKITKAKTLKEQIENYIVEVFEDSLIKYKEAKFLNLEENIKLPQIIVSVLSPFAKKHYDIVAESMMEKIKKEIKTKTFRNKKEVRNYIKEKSKEFNYELDKE